MKTNPNEPANPTEVGYTNGEPDEAFQTGSNVGKFMGLTKREYFAVMAMQGFCADSQYPLENIAPAAVRIADSLIKELNN